MKNARRDSASTCFVLTLPTSGIAGAQRTVVVRTEKGDFAKVKMISCYKDAFTPDKWFRKTPHMYFTFEYVIVPKGSTKFEIK